MSDWFWESVVSKDLVASVIQKKGKQSFVEAIVAIKNIPNIIFHNFVDIPDLTDITNGWVYNGNMESLIYHI